MRNPLSRLETWLCLLGSMLALVAFYLPYATYTSENLVDCLTSCALDRVFGLDSTQFFLGPLGVGLLLLLLLGSAVLAVLTPFLPSPHWKITTTIYLCLTAFSLMYYFGAALITLSLDWVGEAIASTSPHGVTFLDVLSWVGIGAWLLMMGLMLALSGGILLQIRAFMAGH